MDAENEAQLPAWLSSYRVGKNIVKEVQAKAGLPEDPPLMADVIRIQGALNRVWEQVP